MIDTKYVKNANAEAMLGENFGILVSKGKLSSVSLSADALSSAQSSKILLYLLKADSAVHNPATCFHFWCFGACSVIYWKKYYFPKDSFSLSFPE